MTEIIRNATEGNKYDSFIWGILRGRDFEHLRFLQGAVDHKKKISKVYIQETEYTEIFEIGETKKDAIEAREELIKLIVQVLKDGKTRNKDMIIDHYSRLFHALAILKVDKNADFITKESENKMYNAAYQLWQLDDGSKTVGRSIMNACWFISEELKER